MDIDSKKFGDFDAAVTAVEKDPVLADRLKAALGNPERLSVLKGETEAPASIDVPFNLIPRDSVAKLSPRSEDHA